MSAQPSRTDLSRDDPEGNSRRRSVSQPESPSHSKSVAFDLDGNAKADKDKPRTHDTTYGEGYETDDSDSTIDGNDRSHHRHHHHRHPPPPFREHSSNLYEPIPNTDSRHHHHHHHQTPKPTPAPTTRSATRDSSDSEATIDLPDRFDSQGRKLPEEGDDPLADSVEHLLQNIFSAGRPERSANRVW